MTGDSYPEAQSRKTGKRQKQTKRKREKKTAKKRERERESSARGRGRRRAGGHTPRPPRQNNQRRNLRDKSCRIPKPRPVMGAIIFQSASQISRWRRRRRVDAAERWTTTFEIILMFFGIQWKKKHSAAAAAAQVEAQLPAAQTRLLWLDEYHVCLPPDLPSRLVTAFISFSFF